MIHCCLLNVVAWKRPNSGNHARFSQNTALCMQRLQINIQLNPTLYALLNICLNPGLSITLFNTSIRFKVQHPDCGLVYDLQPSMCKNYFYTCPDPLAVHTKEPSLPTWTNIYPKSAKEQESSNTQAQLTKYPSEVWVNSMGCIKDFQQLRAGFDFYAKPFSDRRLNSPHSQIHS